MLNREPDRYALEITLQRNEAKSKQEQQLAVLAMEIVYETNDVLVPRSSVRFFVPRSAAIDLRDKMSEILDS